MNPPNLSDELTYLAATLDVRGSISMHPGGQIRLSVRHRDVEVLWRLRQTFGGTIESTRKPVAATGRLAQPRWVLAGPKMSEVLKAVRPQLRTIGEQADLAIKYYDEVDAGRRKFAHRTEEQRLIAAGFVEKMRRANRQRKEVKVEQSIHPEAVDRLEQLINKLKEEPR